MMAGWMVCNGGADAWRGLVLGFCLALGACGPDCDERPPILTHALSIEIADADSGERVCDASVTLEVDGRSTTLSKLCPYGGGTAAGRYKISVARDGYEATSLEVSVAADECGVPVTKDVTIRLKRRAT